ncbi:GNAT family N-acetyltransferase [Tenggerimyces flavus]|uniref:GNAT family N-acetyltransferase n=1 Tax=Tenggerimyces flavus TaxID=1708749 RepID=A0ABV7YGF8_9ACTN|nr:GNAT family protein [Tenggerimyces flavus]MBM7786015.1 RimJ/RimL family protein N-acetyltransferase [Tenggerimyces flavus]
MLNGERVLLRATTRDDVPMLHRLESDADLQQLTNTRPWRPESLEAAYARYDKELVDLDKAMALFTIVPRDRADEVGSGVGYGLLWGIDVHQRVAHLGLSLVPEARGQGYGLDAVRVLLDYGFRIRALLRIGCETLTTNTGMIKVAEAAGFVREGVLRSVGYVDGERVDEQVFGLLYEEWKQK